MAQVATAGPAYAPPGFLTDELEEPSVHEIVWWAPLAFVLAYWGGAWAWCWAVCRGRVKSCDVKWWGSVRAECR